MKVSAICAVSREWAIGKDNRLPWHLPADLKFFKQTTMGHHVLMGRKSFESIGKALPGRTNLVLTRAKDLEFPGCIRVGSVEEAMLHAQDQGDPELFIIGGAEVYQMTEPYWNTLYLTQVDISVDGDVFFPDLDWAEWEETWRNSCPANDKNPWAYCFRHFVRKSSHA